MSSSHLSSTNFTCSNDKEQTQLQSNLDSLLENDLKGTIYSLLAGYTRVLTESA